jgi:ACDE family multidrug resistance protein
VTLYRSTISTVAPEALRGSLVSLGESVGRIGSTVAPVVMGGAVAVAVAVVVAVVVRCLAAGATRVLVAERATA